MLVRKQLNCSGLDWRWNGEDRLSSCAALSCSSTYTDLTWPRGGNSNTRWTCNVTVTCLHQTHLQHCSVFREKCLPCPCSKLDRWKSAWPRSHVAPGTTLCLTECALQLESTSVVPTRGNLASDPNCTGHNSSGSRLKHPGEEADLQKSITAKAGARPGKAQMPGDRHVITEECEQFPSTSYSSAALAVHGPFHNTGTYLPVNVLRDTHKKQL